MQQHLLSFKNLLSAAMVVTLACHSGNANAQTYRDGIRIAWDYTTQRFVTSGVYARVKKLSDSRLALVYSDGPDVYIRFSSDQGRTWQTPIRVASEAANYNYTNSELIELNDGTLMYAWNARPKNTTVPLKIMAKYSKDKGRTWENEQNIFVAANASNEGCWEPSMVQLPSGELQIYFANEYQVPNDNQNISMRRSFDNGQTWGNTEVVSFRVGSRDGMPVPVCLQDGKGIAFAIEDNGYRGSFKPMIIYTTLRDNWHSGTVTADSRNRIYPIYRAEDIAAPVYAGAPYLIQLSSGETLLSCQSGEGRNNVGDMNTSIMEVYVGSDRAQGFRCKSTPFPMIDYPNANTLWNSLCQVDDSTVMAVSSVGNYSPGGIWICKGKIMKPLQSLSMASTDGDWDSNPSSVFIGSQSQASATVKSSWSNDTLYFHFDVKDGRQNIDRGDNGAYDTDGVEVYLSPTKLSTDHVIAGAYHWLVNISGDAVYEKSENDGWHESDKNINYSITHPDNNHYAVTFAIPWAAIGGKPSANDFTVLFRLNNNDGSNVKVKHEDLSGGYPEKPMTWMRCTLLAPTGITSVKTDTGDLDFKIDGQTAAGQTLRIVMNKPANAEATLHSVTSTLLAKGSSHGNDGIELDTPQYKGLAIVSVKAGKQKVSKKIMIN